MSIGEFLNGIKILVDQLAAESRPLTPAELNVIIFQNICQDYQGILSALNLHPAPIEFNELIGYLFAHEMFLKNSSTLLHILVLQQHRLLLHKILRMGYLPLHRPTSSTYHTSIHHAHVSTSKLPTKFAV